LSLNEADRDGRQLWSGVIAALKTLWPRCGDAALTLLRRPGPIAGVVGQLLDDLDSEADSRGVLVIDDLHLVDDDDVLASLALFLRHLPTWLHVILLSRREPNLPLDRLQARGQLREVRFAELKFSHEEAC
jgi:LuxR family transcriptional regulator, maltose regulon positive regulatory protein